MNIRLPKVTFSCRDCGTPHPSTLPLRCTKCDGLIDAIYADHCPKWADSEHPLVRYSGLLPVQGNAGELPVAFVRTPLVSIPNGPTSAPWKAVAKWEGANPTGSVKDREVGVSLALARAEGVQRMVVASTGNTARAYLHALEASNPDRLFLDIFVSLAARRLLPFPDRSAHHHLHVIEDTYDQVSDRAARFAAENRLQPEGGFFNVGLREGQKTIFFEATEQLGEAPTHYIQAISAAIGIDGVAKANGEALRSNLCSRRTKLIGVQQAGCAPMVRGFEARSPEWRDEFAVNEPSGPAAGIMRGSPVRPYPYIYHDVLQSGGLMVAVPDVEVALATAYANQTLGLDVSPEAAVALAGYFRLALRGAFTAGDVVLVNLTGRRREVQGASPQHRNRNVTLVSIEA